MKQAKRRSYRVMQGGPQLVQPDYTAGATTSLVSLSGALRWVALRPVPVSATRVTDLTDDCESLRHRSTKQGHELSRLLVRRAGRPFHWTAAPFPTPPARVCEVQPASGRHPAPPTPPPSGERCARWSSRRQLAPAAPPPLLCLARAGAGPSFRATRRHASGAPSGDPRAVPRGGCTRPLAAPSMSARWASACGAHVDMLRGGPDSGRAGARGGKACATATAVRHAAHPQRAARVLRGACVCVPRRGATDRRLCRPLPLPSAPPARRAPRRVFYCWKTRVWAHVGKRRWAVKRAEHGCEEFCACISLFS